MSPTYIVLCGVWLILCGTVLYWPSERLADWSLCRDTNPGLKPIERRVRKIMRWIRLDPTSRVIYRAGLVAIGIAMLLFGIAS